MSKEIEIECKNMVTRRDFCRLARAFGIAEHDFKQQKNFYFDTPDFALKRRKSALRVRKKTGRFQLTLKTPEETGLLETSQMIGEKVFQKLKNGGGFPEGEVMDKLMELQVAPSKLVYFGKLVTKRAEIAYEGGLLVFDHNFYLNKEDFEIEYEVSELETGTKQFLKLLETYGIPHHPAKNKVLRFYEAKRSNER